MSFDGEGVFDGLGVTNAVANINQTIREALIGMDSTDQKAIDEKMIALDGTPTKEKLGGNSLIGVSVATLRASVPEGQTLVQRIQEISNLSSEGKPPLLYMNLMNGGKHSDAGLAFQEYQVIPQAETIEENIQIGFEVQNRLKAILKDRFGSGATGVGDEGGFAPELSHTLEPLDLLSEAVRDCGCEDVTSLSLDVAASSFYTDGVYTIDGQEYDTDGLLALYSEMMTTYNISSIEDPFFEEDFDAFSSLLSVGDVYVVGDDLTVTNKTRLQQAIDAKSINALIIKPNQIGTMTETFETMQLAHENDIACVVSHRSGETNDDFVADLAFATGALGIKAGALQRGERVAKYNRLLNLEQYGI